MKLRTTLLTSLLAITATGSMQAAVLAGWDFNGLSGYGASPFASTTTASNITVGGLTRGSGVGTGGTAAANAWGGADFQSADLASAITANKFATFTLTAAVDYTMSLTSISAYNIRRSGTGPTTGQWQYAIGAGTFTNIGSSITWGGTTTAAGNSQSAIDLSGITALQDIDGGETVTFRVVTWGASGTGTWYLNNFQSGDDLVINGTVIPEPTTTLLGGLGMLALLRRRR